jgi:hypothetical protein
MVGGNVTLGHSTGAALKCKFNSRKELTDFRAL